jgi:hypothetical protein
MLLEVASIREDKDEGSIGSAAECNDVSAHKLSGLHPIAFCIASAFCTNAVACTSVKNPLVSRVFTLVVNDVMSVHAMKSFDGLLSLRNMSVNLSCSRQPKLT